MKTLLALTGALLLAAPALHAQQHRFNGGGGGGGGGRPTIDRGHFGDHRGGYGYGGRRHGGWHGRTYYYGGLPYFYPSYGIGFGYPYYGGFGYGYGDGFGYGYGAEGGYPGAYEGRLADRGDNDNNDRNAPSSGHGPSLPSAVQRQLSKKGYYKGSIDGQFGPASRDALSHFQRDNDLRETGRIDEDTLDKLGFTDHP